MNVRIRSASWLLALLVAAAPLARGQALTAEDILDRSGKASFGDKYQGLTSYRAKGKFGVPAQGMSGPMTILAKGPNKLAVHINIPGMGVIEEGYDGTTGWASDPSTGPRTKEGSEAVMARFGAELYGDAVWKTRYKKVTLKGEETIDGRKTYRLELEVEGAAPIAQWIDAETFLPAQTQMEIEVPQGKFTVVTQYSDYRKVTADAFGTLMVPYKTTQTMAGSVQEITIDTIEPNVEIDDAQFAPRK